MKDRLFSLPCFGKYTDLIVEAFKEADFKIIPPPPISKKTIELGIKHAPAETCLPLKVTLGTMIELLDKKTDTLVMFSISSWCVIRCHWTVQKQILENLGYKFLTVVLNPYKPFTSWKGLKKIKPDLNLLKVLKLLISTFKKIREFDLKEKQINKDSPIKIALLGEFYTINENTVNMDVVKKLQELGCYVDRWLGLWGYIVWLFKKIFRIRDLKKYRTLARRYFPVSIAGHTNDNMVRMIKYAKDSFDGIVCLKPMFCGPESVCEAVFDKISQDFNIPIIQFSLNEFSQKARFYDRIEAFVESIKLRKGL